MRRRKERHQEGTVLKPPPVDVQDGVTISLNPPPGYNTPLQQYTITTTTTSTTTEVKEPILQTTTVTMT